jgi:hypothetical protein
VRPDGSGVIEDTVRLSNALVESLQNFSKGFTEANTDADIKDKDKDKGKNKAEVQSPVDSLMKDAKSREKQYGPDVTFVSATPVKTETMLGYKAIYSFKDINALRINQNPESKTGKPADAKDKSQKKEEIIRFNFVKGPVSTLTVTMPENAKDNKGTNEVKKGEQPGKNASDPGAAEMIKMFFKDMSIGIAIEIDGKIIRTNATYQDKSRITLIDMHFGKILENEKVFEKLNAAQPKTIAEMKELVKGIIGLKIEMNNPVVVVFQ